MWDPHSKLDSKIRELNLLVSELGAGFVVTLTSLES
jgi:hypothetical protein